MSSSSLKIFNSIEELARSTEESIILSMGMFDGVHCGHQKVLNHAIKVAGQEKSKAIAFTFPEHPASFLRPESAPSLLMDKNQKADFLIKSGMDGVVLRTFDKEFADIEARHFPAFLTARLPSLTGLCVGENFRFGKGRCGDQNFLKKMGMEVGLSVYVVSSKLFSNSPISSSRIREFLKIGKMREVNEMLGWDYIASGIAVRGKGLGKELGFPTINLVWNPEAKPAYGVYVGYFTDHKTEQTKFAVANYGMRPTVEKNAETPLLEVHILDELDSQIGSEGSQISMTLNYFLRPEKKFDSIEDLKSQISRDLKEAKELR